MFTKALLKKYSKIEGVGVKRIQTMYLKKLLKTLFKKNIKYMHSILKTFLTNGTI